MSPRADPEPRAGIEDLRLAVNELLGTERRLRGRDHSRPGALTHGQIRALAALRREPEMTAGALARSADLNPASVTAMLDHLEAAGMVTRRRSTEDRRVYFVSLTAQGSELLERKLTFWNSLWEARLADLPDEDLEAASRVISQITGIYDDLCARLDAASEATADPPPGLPVAPS